MGEQTRHQVDTANSERGQTIKQERTDNRVKGDGKEREGTDNRAKNEGGQSERGRTPEPVEKEVSEDITSLPDYECLSQKKRCKRDHPQSAQAPNLALVIKHVKQAFKTEIFVGAIFSVIL